MDIKDIKEGKTFYQMRITRAGQIYELNKIKIDAIRGNIECIFQIKYTIPNSDFISYKSLYERLYVEVSNSPYFIKMGDEEYFTLPNKQALMKAVRAQIMEHSFLFYPQLKPITNLYYRNAMRLIKKLH
jgi:hypothetical protein